MRENRASPATTGIVLHQAFLYDLFLWLVTLGRESAYRQKALNLARLRPGETVLDIGWGTGTLAIAAKRRVGTGGRVYGVDASPEMLARASRKANKPGASLGCESHCVGTPALRPLRNAASHLARI